ncbi:hypothetical protein GR7B_00110 [Vibrio phage vB_VcorM_GR7B]|nr:hypothetical protein GR7B_00110 [Vibrio phage vB_VcorM_GR7B]
MDKDRIVIHSPKCLYCKHFCGELGVKKFKKCHYEQGNDSCPAQYMQVVEGTDFEKASDALADAMRESNSDKLAKIHTKLAEYDPLVQQRIRDMANEKLNGTQ